MNQTLALWLAFIGGGVTGFGICSYLFLRHWIPEVLDEFEENDWGI